MVTRSEWAPREVDYEALAHKLGRGAPLVDLLGLRLQSLGRGAATVLVPEDPRLHNGGGSLHAGTLFAAADVAAGAALYGLMAPLVRLGELQILTASSWVRFRRPAVGKMVAAATVRGDLDELTRGWGPGHGPRLDLLVEVQVASPEGGEPVATLSFDCVVRAAGPARRDRLAPR